MQSLFAELESCQLGDEAVRLFHGRGHCFDGLSHVNIDYFPPAIFITLYQPVTAEWLDELVAGIRRCLPNQSETVLVQHRDQPGSPVHLLGGELPNPHWVKEAGLQYQVKLTDGQNNGLFLDMANGRQWLRDLAKDRNVLNLFSYTCSFSVAALASGASQVINIDMSHGALKLGKINHKLNGFPSEKVKFLRHDIFKSWGKLKRYGPYQAIVIDPPTSQYGSFMAVNDYAKLVRRIPQLASPGADLLLCLNAPELPMSFITELMATEAPDCQLVGLIDNPASFKEIDANKGLKVFHYRYQPEQS